MAVAAGCTAHKPFVQVKDGQFYRNGQPYSYVGANFWYGPILASEGRISSNCA